MPRTRTEQEQEQCRLRIAVKTAGGLVGYYYVEIKSFQILNDYEYFLENFDCNHENLHFHKKYMDPS